VGETSPFAPPVLTWRVYAAFGDAGFVAAHPRLQAYLQQADEVMRYELARRVAALLDQYITYRPDWLQAWQSGRQAAVPPAAQPADATTQAARDDERWQAALWRRITDTLGIDALHPAQRFIEVLQRDDRAGRDDTRPDGRAGRDDGRPGGRALGGLPTHAHLFALPAMPPLYLKVLQQLGRWVELHVYILNPCREYWFELIDRARLSHLQARGRAHGHETGNRLLADWGRQTQSHVDLLVDAAGETAQDDGHYDPHPGTTLLAQVHNAILDLRELAPG